MRKHLHVILATFLLTIANFPVYADTSSEKQGVKMVIVDMHTNHGLIKLELDPGKAPESVANFVQYAKSGHYDGTIFHRVMPGFVIQGGGFEADMQQKATKAPIKNEADNGLKNNTGTIAMARTSDPNSATCQFFINLVDNDFLNFTSPSSPNTWGYAVFGKVIEGMDVVKIIERLPTHTVGAHRGVPVDNATIEKVTIVSE